MSKDFAGTADVNGAKVYVEASGSGPGLVFIHAGVADSRMWDAEFAAFADRFRVVRFDIRGFGRSPMVPGDFAYYDDVPAVMDAAGLSSAVLVGCSFGANIAIDTCFAHPGRVRGLVAVAPGLGLMDDDPDVQKFGEEEDELLSKGDLEGATELNLRMWVDGPFRQPGEVSAEVRERVRVMQMDAFRIPMPEGVRRLRLDPPASERLGQIKVPALVVVGAMDLPALFRIAGMFEATVPGAR
ncbi:MAG: alpha/beta fold hydrolase, partial [Candidatus Eiseniibacteriota bacterium]